MNGFWLVTIARNIGHGPKWATRTLSGERQMTVMWCENMKPGRIEVTDVAKSRARHCTNEVTLDVLGSNARLQIVAPRGQTRFPKMEAHDRHGLAVW